MNSIQENLPFFTSLFDCLQANLGDNTELVLYDLTAPSGPVIADIRNGRISNGTAGFGKELLSQKTAYGHFRNMLKPIMQFTPQAAGVYCAALLCAFMMTTLSLLAASASTRISPKH